MSTQESTKNLGSIPETMLITLWAKAQEFSQEKPLLVDKKAKEIIDKVDYDFTKFKNSRFSQAGICIRANLIDNETKAFIEKNPDCIVIQLGAWLDGRFDRLWKPNIAHWYDLDLPEAMELRRQFFTESENNSFLDISLFDYSWIDTVLAHNKPVLIIIEWVLMYFEEKEVKDFFDTLCKKFEKATVLTDILAFWALWKEKYHDSVKTIKNKPAFKWSILETKDIEKWNEKIHLEKEYYMSEYDEGRYPLIARILYKIPYFYKKYNQRVAILEIK